MNNRQVDATVVSVVLSFCALMWWPTRELPFHWDSAGFVALAAQELLGRDFSPFVVQYTPFAHPPLFIAALALGWKLFGPGLLVGHVLLLPFLPLLLLGTYGVGVRAYNRRVGIAATALVATVPVVIAEYGQVYFDLPLAALLTFALWLWLYERRLLAGLVLGASIGFKIPAIVVPSVLLLVGAVQAQRENQTTAARRAALRRLWPLAIPFLVLAAWLLYHHAVKGFWLQRPMRNTHKPQGAAELLRNAWAVTSFLFAQQRWVIAAFGLLAALAQVARRQRTARSFFADPAGATLALIVVVGIAFFAAADVFAQRYGILMLPPIFVLVAAALDKALDARPLILWGAIGIGCALQVNGWLPAQAATNRPEYRPDENLHYLDMIALGRDTANMQREHPNAHVFGTWPEAYWLTNPLLGYVAQPLAFSDCREYRADMPGEKLIVAHLYSPDQPSCWQLIQATGAQPLKKLSSSAKWLQIFRVK